MLCSSTFYSLSLSQHHRNSYLSLFQQKLSQFKADGTIIPHLLSLINSGPHTQNHFHIQTSIKDSAYELLHFHHIISACPKQEMAEFVYHNQKSSPPPTPPILDKDAQLPIILLNLYHIFTAVKMALCMLLLYSLVSQSIF